MSLRPDTWPGAVGRSNQPLSIAGEALLALDITVMHLDEKRHLFSVYSIYAIFHVSPLIPPSRQMRALFLPDVVSPAPGGNCICVDSRRPSRGEV